MGSGREQPLSPLAEAHHDICISLSENIDRLLELGSSSCESATAADWVFAEDSVFAGIHKLSEQFNISNDESGLEKRKHFALAIDAHVRKGVNPLSNITLSNINDYKKFLRRTFQMYPGFLNGNAIDDNYKTRFEEISYSLSKEDEQSHTAAIYLGNGMFDSADSINNIDPTAEPDEVEEEAAAINRPIQISEPFRWQRLKNVLNKFIIRPKAYQIEAGQTGVRKPFIRKIAAVALIGIVAGGGSANFTEKQQSSPRMSQAKEVEMDESIVSIDEKSAVNESTVNNEKQSDAQSHSENNNNVNFLLSTKSNFGKKTASDRYETQSPSLAPPEAIVIIQKGESIWRSLKNHYKNFDESNQEADKKIFAAMPAIIEANPEIQGNPNLVFSGQVIKVNGSAYEILTGSDR